MENESDQGLTPYHIRRIRGIWQAGEERQPTQPTGVDVLLVATKPGASKTIATRPERIPATPSKSREFTRHSDHRCRRIHGLQDETPSMVLSWKDQELDSIHGSHRRERPEEVRKVECPLNAILHLDSNLTMAVGQKGVVGFVFQGRCPWL